MSTLLDASAPPLRIWKTGPAHWLVIALCAAATLVAFYPALSFMVATWSAVEEYSYGYFIPVISAFLIWQRSDRLRLQPFHGNASGLLLVALGLVLNWVADASAIRVIGQYGFVVAVFGISVCSIGWRGTRIIAVPLAILFFMIPLPQFMLREVSHGLQLVSSQLGVALIRLFGISVYLEGNVIDLGSYKLQVVEACNGLRYLFPLMVLGFLMAYSFQGAMWKRVVLVLATIPLTIVINSLRIGLIGVTVEHWGRDMAEGLVHDFEGWFMFMICLALLLALMAVLARIGGGGKKLSDVFGIDLPDPVAKGSRPAEHPLSLASMACAMLLLATAALALTAGERKQTAPERRSFDEFPLKIDGIWQGRLDRIERDVLNVLAVDDYFIANYQQAEGPWVNFYVAYYATQSSGQSSHSPRTCIPGGGWSISQIEQFGVPIVAPDVKPVAGSPMLGVNRAIIQKGEQKQLVYYWFSQRGRTLTNEFAVKWYVLYDSITRNRSDGALVRIITPILPNEPDGAADQRLAAFLGTVEPRLADYVPR